MLCEQCRMGGLLGCQTWMREFLEGEIPDAPGVKLEMKKSGEEDDCDLYFDLPLKEDEEFYAVHWGGGRRAAALYREREFDKLSGALQDAAQCEGPGQWYVRRYVRLLFLSAHFCSYHKGLGFDVSPLMLDETLARWEYVEVPEGDMLLNSLDPAYACPFAFIAAR